VQRLVLLAVLGTAFFYCDALITPAISVLGAVEGLTTIDAGFQRYVVPSTLVILVALFAIQRRGTEKIGRCSDRSCCCGSPRSGSSGFIRSSRRRTSWRR
jgi:K+ transporter